MIKTQDQVGEKHSTSSCLIYTVGFSPRRAPLRQVLHYLRCFGKHIEEASWLLGGFLHRQDIVTHRRGSRLVIYYVRKMSRAVDQRKDEYWTWVLRQKAEAVLGPGLPLDSDNITHCALLFKLLVTALDWATLDSSDPPFVEYESDTLSNLNGILRLRSLLLDNLYSHCLTFSCSKMYHSTEISILTIFKVYGWE